ncbi:MAG TPA: acyl-CoA reductase [Roseateles sp.]
MSEPDVLLPTGGRLEDLLAAPDLPVFGELQLAFAAALSRALTQSPEARAHAELVALGFWLRPAHLRTLVEAQRARAEGGGWLQPRGLCFHVAPGNVDTIFVYSWMLSLLCGNRSVVRLSSRDSEQTRCLLGVLARQLALPEWQEIARRVLVLRYGHDDAISGRLSAACDIRIVWGGDNAVRALRALPLPTTATELCFPDKFSLAVLDVAAVAALDDTALAQLAQRFTADAYSFGQMACSSPRLVLWHGEAAAARAGAERFWAAVAQRVAGFAHGLEAADAMNKRVAVDLLAMAQPGVQVLPTTRSVLQRVWLDAPAVLPEAHCGGGLFHEASFEQFGQLAPLWSRRVQTVSQFGLGAERWQAWLAAQPVAGIDRIVPVGRALDFDPVWDGQDLWAAFTRRIAWMD